MRRMFGAFLACGTLAALMMAAPAAKADSLFGLSYYAPDAVLPNDYVLGPTTPGKWGPSTHGTGATVTWSLMATGTSRGIEGDGTFTALADFMPAGYKTAIEAAFAAWSAVADLIFVEVADQGEVYNATTQLSGDIRIGGHVFDGPGGTLAHGYYPPVNGASAAGDIHFDIEENWKIGFGGPGFDIFQVMAHEIGHAIGLAHTGVPNSLMNPFYTEAFSGPQADDIAGAQFIYGEQVIPEPSTLAMTGSALLLLVGMVVVRRKPGTAIAA